jgi:hypothetical protein
MRDGGAGNGLCVLVVRGGLSVEHGVVRLKSPLLYQLSYRVGPPETSPGDVT